MPTRLAAAIALLIAGSAAAGEVSPYARTVLSGVGVAIEMKVTGLTGEMPRGHDPDAFEQWAMTLIASGFEVLRPAEYAAIAGDDRLYYLDFHPYRSDDGELFVSTALYTEFDCVNPAYERYSGPCGGSWEELAKVFAIAARDLEDQVLSRLQSPEQPEGICEVGAHPEEPAEAAAVTAGGGSSLPKNAP